mmetsp:Transcript_75621/g.208646  ORF Transcript_75621/g.208646 Transcript_75621/m.208646 type:complete len:349 (-) Transcript_75621:310-1356(-)
MEGCLLEVRHQVVEVSDPADVLVADLFEYPPFPHTLPLGGAVLDNIAHHGGFVGVKVDANRAFQEVDNPRIHRIGRALRLKLKCHWPRGQLLHAIVDLVADLGRSGVFAQLFTVDVRQFPTTFHAEPHLGVAVDREPAHNHGHLDVVRDAKRTELGINGPGGAGIFEVEPQAVLLISRHRRLNWHSRLQGSRLLFLAQLVPPQGVAQEVADAAEDRQHHQGDQERARVPVLRAPLACPGTHSTGLRRRARVPDRCNIPVLHDAVKVHPHSEACLDVLHDPRHCGLQWRVDTIRVGQDGNEVAPLHDVAFLHLVIDEPRMPHSVQRGRLLGLVTRQRRECASRADTVLQ